MKLSHFLRNLILKTENLHFGKLVDDAKHILLEKRGNVEEKFRKIFKTISDKELQCSRYYRLKIRSNIH